MCALVYMHFLGHVPTLFIILETSSRKVAEKNRGKLNIVVFIQGSKIHEFANDVFDEILLSDFNSFLIFGNINLKTKW